ncbi:MAG: hypothetical protein IKH89_05915 [Bacteroidales bacterium]|nr:hypothetical protein [Bacteroidales bacterium]
MPLYQHSNGKLSAIKEKPFKLEKEIQNLVEANLKQLLDLDFVQTELTVQDVRFDTLAYDSTTNSFVIIEYKKDSSTSIFDQGVSYLNQMLKNQAECVLAYNNARKTNFNKSDFDWSQSRIVFICREFSEKQKMATDFKDLSIELWEVRRYANDTLMFSQLGKSKHAVSITPLMKSSNNMKDVLSKTIPYSEDSLFKGFRDDIYELYEKFRDGILALDSEIVIKFTKLYAAFKKGGSNVCDLEPFKNSLCIFINLSKGELKDGLGLAKDVSNTGHHGNGDYRIQIRDAEQYEYILSLIKQALK